MMRESTDIFERVKLLYTYVTMSSIYKEGFEESFLNNLTFNNQKVKEMQDVILRPSSSMEPIIK